MNSNSANTSIKRTQDWIDNSTCRASDISRKKTQNFAGFSREKSQNSLTNRPISREKSQNSQKIDRFRGISVEKSQISKDFRGKF